MFREEEKQKPELSFATKKKSETVDGGISLRPLECEHEKSGLIFWNRDIFYNIFTENLKFSFFSTST